MTALLENPEALKTKAGRRVFKDCKKYVEGTEYEALLFPQKPDAETQRFLRDFRAKDK
jgi:hypothetical protein